MQWEVAEVTVTQAKVWEISEVTAIASNGGAKKWEIAAVSVTSTSSLAIITSDTDFADAGQPVLLQVQGNTGTHTWAVVSTTNGAATPTITVAPDTLSAICVVPRTNTGTVLTIGVTPPGGSQATKIITVYPATIQTNVGGSSAPSYLLQDT